jgi:Fanconi anemia group M protein
MEKDESPLKPVIDSLRKRVLEPKPMVLIFADSREFSSDVIKELDKYECSVRQKMLTVGDYLLSDRVCVERKTADDFLSSITDKRLFSQLTNLKDNFERPILLIEGNDLYGRLSPNAVRGALASIALDFNVPLIWTKNAEETAGIIYWIARREQLDERRDVSLRGDKKAETVGERQEFLVSGLPGISVTRARSLLKHFRTPAAVFSANAEELAKAENLGPVTAKNIRLILDENYEPKRRQRQF